MSYRQWLIEQGVLVPLSARQVTRKDLRVVPSKKTDPRRAVRPPEDDGPTPLAWITERDDPPGAPTMPDGGLLAGDARWRRPWPTLRMGAGTERKAKADIARRRELGIRDGAELGGLRGTSPARREGNAGERRLAIERSA